MDGLRECCVGFILLTQLFVTSVVMVGSLES